MIFTRGFHIFGRALAAPAALWLLLAPLALAHGVDWRWDDAVPARTVQILFSTGEPMAFAEVEVRRPDGLVHHAGRADNAGRFAFVTDGVPGEWRLTAKDGMGHQVTIPVLFDGAALTAAEPARKGPGWLSALLGLSLIANLTALMHWLRRRP